jgi:RNA polymerase sigma-70 factor (ECF subfamily)
VQDALLQTFRRLSHFEPRRDRALQAYLRMAVDNRIRDEIRRVARRPQTDEIESVEPLAVQGPSPLEQTIDREEWARYREGLGRLKRADQTLIVGRVELGYSHKQLALVSGRRGPEAARIALRRALVRLAAEMKHEG